MVEQGTHDELLAAGGRYAVLHATQFDPLAGSEDPPGADHPDVLVRRA